MAIGPIQLIVLGFDHPKFQSIPCRQDTMLAGKAHWSSSFSPSDLPSPPSSLR